MNKLLASFFAFVCSISLAQDQNSPQCGPFKDVVAKLYANFGEKPVWVGKGDDGQNYAVLSNQEKKSWTLIVFSERTACLLTSGSDSEILQKIKNGSKIRAL